MPSFSFVVWKEHNWSLLVFLLSLQLTNNFQQVQLCLVVQLMWHESTVHMKGFTNYLMPYNFVSRSTMYKNINISWSVYQIITLFYYYRRLQFNAAQKSSSSTFLVIRCQLRCLARAIRLIFMLQYIYLRHNFVLVSI